MVYFESWDEFFRQSEALYRAAPLRTRFCTKYRHKDGALVLKVTDDVQCLKYKTDQAADLKKVEKLNALCLSLMGRGLDANPGDLVAAPAAQSGAQKGGGGGGGGGTGSGKAGGGGVSRGGKAGGRRG